MRFIRFVLENWAFLLAGVLLSFTSSYGQTYFISLFAGEIMATFDLTDGQWGGIYTLGTTASALVMVWVGGLTDRFRVRAITPLVLIGLMLACLAMAGVPGPAFLIAVIFALRFFGQGMLSHLAVVAMARWFVATRGTALSISAMGFGLGQAILPIIFVALLAIVDWRILWIVAAGLVVVIIPVIAYLLRLERTPQAIAKDSQSLGMNGQHWKRSDMLRHPLFWFVIPLLFGPPAWGTALFFQQVHLTEVKGWSLASYVALNPILILAATVSTFASGALVDKLGTGKLLPFYPLPAAVAFALMAGAETILGAGVALVIFGISAGMQATVPGAFWAEYYGTRHVGSIKAAAVAIMVFGSAAGPGITGWLIDLGIDFPSQMWPIAIYYVLSGLLAWIGLRRVGPLPRPT
ncbi:MFS transporter [Ponticoccus sp. SC2-23]|uniref:MFS transporter n=1 Tax=Alexandriicola marinus TaxID=2081710 RepID=UPI000FD75AFB|nr:MFS transporter [Alexandriicola marinus]MBM1220737.1 MFS transporter [Ponticoccus sp. SC6-9]MBM1225996.1 MFS transporter [Ponticoccus sp. SC6-15]MBM1231293.1 MFS transporter [Ponticoccus sp. SC6-38]MBM1235846.1 MFS transporter [Ponticoccus sp. SC6-45]MBM1240316.1 MFS transporter [Ponticoccus sp. SC6-49]MBM1244851.1 MFS transporter [Ponticoccus sp. SC2-64]MBM1249320.1 MFS transporter [Ponticoccus sp. SC6-42]MBM1252392.1 MFS transporter [Ponticoccus sp. SC6-33]MBM1258323.1 MFS transporter